MQNNLYQLDIAIEQAVLAAIFYEQQEIETVKKYLSPQDFYTKEHQIIFEKLLEFEQEHNNTEFLLFADYVKGLVSESILTEIYSTNPIANVEQYCKRIKEKSKRNKAIKDLITLAEKINKDELSEFKYINELNELVEQKRKYLSTRFAPKKFDDIEDAVLEFWLKDWLPIPKYAMILITAKGGIGKSFASLQIAQRIAIESPKSRILCWMSEEPLSITKERTKQTLSVINEDTQLKKLFNTDKFEQPSNIDYLGNETLPFHVFEQDNRLNINESWYEFIEFAKRYDVIVIDPLIAFYGGEENSNSQARFFMDILSAFCIINNITLIIIHHHNRKQDEARGAGAFVDAARLHYVLKELTKEENNKEESTDSHLKRNFQFKKDNWGVKLCIKDNKDNGNLIRKIFSDTILDKTIDTSELVLL